MKVLVKEVGSTYQIEFSEKYFTPPYRIENMTKYDLLISQLSSRAEEKDLINSYQIMNYAFSHPLNEKTLKIDLKKQTGQTHISDVKLDSFKNQESIIIVDNKNKINYVITITREDAVKVIRIQEEVEFKIDHVDEEDDLQKRGFTYEVIIPKFGISLINSATPEEIAYMYFKNIEMCLEVTKNFQKFKLEILAIQIDDQLAPQEECIVMKKNGGGGKNFIDLNYCLVNNQGYEHVIHYKEFYLKLHPILLFLNGNFCSNMFKYNQSVLTNLLIILNQSEESLKKKKLSEMVPDVIKKKVKKLKKNIYFENFFIDKMSIKFSFISNPSFLNQTQFNPTLKFFIAMLMNMKQVELHFQRYTIGADPLIIKLFMSNIKNHYLNE